MSESTFYFNPFALISFSSFLIMMVLALLLWNKYYTAQTKFVLFLFIANAIYSFFYAFEISFKTVEEITWFYRLEYLGIPFLSSYYLMFALDFSGRSKWLTKRNMMAILIIPIVTLVLVFTNEQYHLYYDTETMNFSGPYASFSFHPAFWYYFHQGYVIVSMLLSLILLGSMLKNAAAIYRQQIWFLLLATLFPFIGYLAYQFHLVPFGIDPVSFTFTLTGIAVYIALVRFKLFGLLPVARTKLFEKVEDRVLVLDLENRLVDYNHSASQQFNLTSGDLGNNIATLLANWPDMMQFIQQNHSGRLDLQHFENGVSHFFDIHILELENSKKVKQGKLVVISDVSELINSERERNYTASKLDAVIQAMPDIMLIINDKGVFTDFFASEAERLFLNKEEVIGASLFHLFNQEEAGTLKELLANCLKSNELITHQLEMKFPGDTRHYEARLSRIDDTHALTIIRDVSESFNMKQDLIYQSGFQKILMNLASRFIYIAEMETDFVIVDSLRQIGEYTGVDRCYIFHYDFENDTMTNTHEWCRQGITPLAANRQHISIHLISDWLATHQKGEPAIVDNVSLLDPGSPVRTLIESNNIKSILTIPMISHKNCLGFVGFDSVHARKKWSESELSSLKIFTGMKANLLEKITIEQSLAEASIKAEASNRLKTAFMNNISHEIRTPLNGIIGFGEIIANEQLSMEEKNKFLTVVQESSERLIHTIDDYLDISMLVTGNQEIHQKHFNLSKLISEVVDEFMEPCLMKNLSISAEVPASLKQTTIYSDPELIHKILSHLVGNAVKFTQKGNILIGMSTKADHLTLFVKDTGIGIAEKAQKFIFDSFMQEDFSSTRMYEGSGLGLSIVHGIVVILGGEITVESSKGVGSTFSIIFPFTRK